MSWRRAIEAGFEVVSAQPDEEWETLGVNSKQQLAELERIHQHNVAESLLIAGVTLADPARIDVRGTLDCGRDVSIDVNCVFEGQVTLADNVTIGPNCVIRNATLGAGTRVEAFTHIEGAQVGAQVVLGPYARLRPGASLNDESHVGNFVEVKNAVLGHGSKANHLTYIGDADIGARVNIGAGTITCNYDGANKFRTIIEDDVFVGSDTQLVAPVRDRPRRDDCGGHDGLEGRRRKCAGPERQDPDEQSRLCAPHQEEKLNESGVLTVHALEPNPCEGIKSLCAALLAQLRNVISFPSWSKDCVASNIVAMIHAAWPCLPMASRAVRAASHAWPISTSRCARVIWKASRASPTLVGRRMARP